jgi:hypothetical protein
MALELRAGALRVSLNSLWLTFCRLRIDHAAPIWIPKLFHVRGMNFFFGIIF